jgi:hypothetical protein
MGPQFVLVDKVIGRVKDQSIPVSQLANLIAAKRFRTDFNRLINQQAILLVIHINSRVMHSNYPSMHKIEAFCACLVGL